MYEIPRLTIQPAIFVGRRKELSRLAELVRRYRHRLTPILIRGSGGIGKTTLVREFVTQRYSGKEVSWLNIHESSDPKRLIDEFLIYLRANSVGAPTVVVIDGAEVLSNNAIQESFGRIFNYKRVEAILVTTRDFTRVPRAALLDLVELNDEDSIAILKAYTGSSLSESELLDIATRVNQLPLALRLIGGLLKNDPSLDLSSFLQGRLYSFESASPALSADVIEVVKPQVVVANEFIIEQLKRRPEDIYQIPPRRFEELIAELVGNMGWEVHLTGETRDGGKDILAYLNTEVGRILCLIEAKRYRRDRPVGVDLIRNLYGTFCDYQANSAMLVTTSHFSPDAKEFQKRHPYQLSLRDYSDVMSWIRKYKTM
jgi:restriction system protein